MSEIITVGLDLARNVFVAFGASSIQVHGADGSGPAVLRKKLRRDQVLAFLGGRGGEGGGKAAPVSRGLTGAAW